MNATTINQSNINQLKMSQNINQMNNNTQAYSDINRPYQLEQPKYIELCGCSPKSIVPIMKVLLAFIMVGSIIGFILSIVGACYSGDDWKGDQPQETYALFITNIVLCVFVFFLSLLIFIQLQTKNFDTGIKFEMNFIFVLGFLACSLAGGIIINTIDQSSSVAYSCSQVYQKIWPSSVLDASQVASENFCTINCPCAYSTNSQATYPLSGYFDAAGPVNAIGCKTYVPLSGSTVSLLKSLEQEWKCAGICDVSNRYLFTDINRGKPNQEQSCFSVASQKLYPLRNLFLGGDFSISLLQIIIMLFLLKMKTFLDRDDVRLSQGVKTVDQEKQALYAGSIIADNNQNASIIHDQSSVVRPDPDQSSYIHQQQQQVYQAEPIQQPIEMEQNRNLIKKESFHQPLAVQMNNQPVYESQKQNSLPKNKPNQVVPLNEVLNNNSSVQNPYNDQTPYIVKEQSNQFSDLEYQLQRDKLRQQNGEESPFDKQPTFAPQQFQNDDFRGGEEQYPPVQQVSQSPVRNNYIPERKKTIEHPPVDNLFDDDLSQMKNRNNLNYTNPMQRSNVNHPLAQLQMQNRLPSSSNQSVIVGSQSPIKKSQAGGFSVLASTGNQTLQNRQIATPQIFLDNDDSSRITHNVDMVKPKNQSVNNPSRVQNNYIPLNLEASAPNSSFQLNDNFPRSAVSQNQSTVSNNNNTNKKFFSKSNQNNNFVS